MTYDDAMKLIRRNGKVTVGLNEMRVAWRFGRPVRLTGGRSPFPADSTFIDYTPTRDDMQSTDWVQLEGAR